MTYLVIDVECTTKNKGNPFTQRNKLVNIGTLHSNTINIDYYVEGISKTQELINNSETLITFNGKFDLHWLRRVGIRFDHCRIWDCQLAHFIITGQSKPYPSLNEVCEYYGLKSKLDVVKTEYWDRGIDTDAIPRDVLDKYLTQDLELTEKVYHNQYHDITKGGFSKLFSLQCQDLLVLADMEYNGMMFNTDKAAELATDEEYKIQHYELELQKACPDVPINWNSRDHLSCYLYGGKIDHEQRIVIGEYKTGAKIGQPRYKKLVYTHELPRQVEPQRGSELAKEGYYATDDSTLRNIKATKTVRERINTILERSKSSKLLGTYYRGLPELIEEMDWPRGTIHGTFNQCVAATGRLSSSKPNLQNFAGEVKQLLISRYP